MAKATQAPGHKNKGLLADPHPLVTKGVRTLNHPNVISIESNGTTSYWARHWTHFELTLEQYELVRILPLAEADTGLGSSWQLGEIARKAEKQSAGALTAKERKILADDGMACVQTDDRPARLEIRGRADLGLTGITVLSVRDPKKDHEEYKEYSKKFFQLFVEIKLIVTDHNDSSEELPKTGHFFILDDDLYASFFVRMEKVKSFLDSIRGIDRLPKLDLRVQALVFRDEHLSDFLGTPAIIYDISTPAILNAVVNKQTSIDPEPVGPSPEPSMQDIAKQMRGIKWALWILAAAVVLAAVIVVR